VHVEAGSIVGHAAAVVHATVLPEEVHGKLPPLSVTVAQQTGVTDPHPAGETQGWPPSPEPPLLEPELDAEPLLEPELEAEPLLEPELDPLLPPDPELEPDEDPELELELASPLESAPESGAPPPPVLLLLLHDVATKNEPTANAKMEVERLRMAQSSVDHGIRSAATVPATFRRCEAQTLRLRRRLGEQIVHVEAERVGDGLGILRPLPVADGVLDVDPAKSK